MMKKLAVVMVSIVCISICPLFGIAQGAESFRVGCVETSLALVEKLAPYVESKGYKVEPIIFDNNVNVIRSANDGGIDAALGVHKPFMEKFNADNKRRFARCKCRFAL